LNLRPSGYEPDSSVSARIAWCRHVLVQVNRRPSSTHHQLVSARPVPFDIGSPSADHGVDIALAQKSRWCGRCSVLRRPNDCDKRIAVRRRPTHQDPGRLVALGFSLSYPERRQAVARATTSAETRTLNGHQSRSQPRPRTNLRAGHGAQMIQSSRRFQKVSESLIRWSRQSCDRSDHESQA
jgi:hypothetical protein